MRKPIIIAEACCNHKGDINIAKEMIIQAKNSGADYIKFQKRDIDSWVKRRPDIYKKPHPDKKNAFGDSYENHRRYLEFDIDTHRQLKKYCDAIGINYACSVFDIESAKQIISLNPKIIKIASACNMNFELLQYICDNFNGEIHLSVGMTYKKDIEKIVQFFIKNKRNSDLVVYACTSSYPLKPQDVCLLEINYLIEKYSKIIKSIGYSGHHQGIIIDVAAFTLGAEYIERHFTLNKQYKGTDQSASIEPTELAKLKSNLEDISFALKNKDKEILDVELSNKEKLKW